MAHTAHDAEQQRPFMSLTSQLRSRVPDGKMTCIPMEKVHDGLAHPVPPALRRSRYRQLAIKSVVDVRK